MFAGHIGAALAIGRVERSVNVSAFIVAAMLLDAVLWVLILLGWESVTIPADFVSSHQPEFVFPYSHGLFAGIAWSVLAGVVTFCWYPRIERKARAAILIGVAVFSHWLLDVLVHVPELPLVGAGSYKVGLGLWHRIHVALVVEGVILVAGLCLFLRGSNLPMAKRTWLTLLCLLILVFTVIGMTVAPPPPSVFAMAASSLITILVVGAIACWLGRRTT